MRWGALIRSSRSARGLTQAQLAEHIAADNTSISRIENDLAIGSLPTVLGLRSFLGLDDTLMLDAIERTLRVLQSRAAS